MPSAFVINPTLTVNTVAIIAVAKANPLEKLATRAAAEVNGAISPAMVALIVSRIVATVVLTAVVSMTEGSFSITLGVSFLTICNILAAIKGI